MNRLARATSPYLLQHAHNPVDWYEWGPEALARAQAENKPIFLSIGYAACHWCHVMAHESFEDPAIAEILNRHFINIKVDREERPDLDAIYMDAVIALTRQGGWPMSVFLTPTGEPFYAGTYFPPHDRYGIPSFRRVLMAVIEAWEQRRERVLQSAAQLTAALAQSTRLRPDPGSLSPALLDAAFDALYQAYDDEEGGFGTAPKFPPAMTLEFLLRQHLRTGRPGPLAMATHTLRKMAAGGIYDQLGGGFHRYSTDAHWLVPHFEKMLYDNALLARAYLYAWQITGEPLFRRIVEETLDYVVREMTHPAGGFYSSQDADSEGEEGKFFLWTLDEVRAILGEPDATLISRYFGMTPAGNFEGHGPKGLAPWGKNILHVAHDLDTMAQEVGMDPTQLQEVIERGRRRLFAARERRVRPGRDEKVLAAWNGLMLRAFAEAGAALDRPDYLAVAVRNAEFLRREMTTPRGRLYRSWKDGHAAVPAYLEDYTLVAEGLIALYQVTFDLKYLREADRLLGIVHTHFWDPEHGAAFQTADDHETLIVRRKDFFDNAEPSGNSAYAFAALRLARLLDKPDYVDRAVVIFRFMRQPMTVQPSGFGYLLSALDFYLRPSREIAIIGVPDAPDTMALRRAVYRRWLPDTVMAGAAPNDTAAQEAIPLLRHRPQLEGRATAYVCRNYACNLPVTDVEALEAQLAS